MNRRLRQIHSRRCRRSRRPTQRRRHPPSRPIPPRSRLPSRIRDRSERSDRRSVQHPPSASPARLWVSDGSACAPPVSSFRTGGRSRFVFPFRFCVRRRRRPRRARPDRRRRAVDVQHGADQAHDAAPSRPAGGLSGVEMCHAARDGSVRGQPRREPPRQGREEGADAPRTHTPAQRSLRQGRKESSSHQRPHS